MNELVFPSDFTWGCATASYQVEGATHEGGRKPSIWDTFCRVPGKVYAGENGDVAIDHYHRFKQDIALMKSLGIQAYRFSIAWPRIMPDGKGAVNPEGVAFYRDMCNEIHAQGMKAYATLYHWDLPQSVEDAGGWTIRTTAYECAAYAGACFDALGDVVDSWITLNEPFCSSILGYYYGVHAPGHQDLGQCVKAMHYLNLAHGLIMQEYRKRGLSAPIGITWNPQTPRPATNSEKDKQAARNAWAFETEVFMNPVLGYGYPKVLTDEFQLQFTIEQGDMELISQKIDFIGINYYNEYPVTFDEAARFHYTTLPTWQETTANGWPMVPAGFKRLLCWINEVSGGIPMYITENGCAGNDVVTPEGRVHDMQRIRYLQQHLQVCSDLIAEGLPLKGYFIWSMFDNFEWAFGYTHRFGIVHVDYTTLARTLKDSAYFYRDVIAGYGQY